MVIPSKIFTKIADASIDADSPITADLMTEFRDNDIFLEEWLGDGYTAAKNHDHDGVNSARIALASYLGQHSVDINGASWSISTGSLGFDPNAMMIQWGFGSVTNVYMGTGWASGTSDQGGMSHRYNVSGPNWEGSFVDATDIMGLSTTGNFGAFATEQAQVTVWGSGGVTIATTSGAWFGGSLIIYINVYIWGA